MGASRESLTIRTTRKYEVRIFYTSIYARFNRRCFRAYLAGLLLQRDRNNALTTLVGTGPIMRA
jgi:hypothetical protein